MRLIKSINTEKSDNRLHDLTSAACKSILLLLGLSGYSQAAEPCGAPSYDSGSETAVFVWQNCASGDWHARFTAGAGYTRYTGTVSADTPLLRVALTSIESSDVVDFSSDPTTIDFNVHLAPPWQDGFEFAYPTGAKICVSIDAPANATVLVGPNRVAAPLKFDPETLGACGPGSGLPGLSIGDASAAEGAGTVIAPVTLSTDSNDTVTVGYSAIDGSATAGDDYILTNGTLTFPPGSSNQNIVATILNDMDSEGPEEFTIVLSNPSNAELFDATGKVSIIDDEVSVCGEPSYDPAAATAIYIWKDCSSGQWKARYAVGGGYTRFTGTITASQPFNSVELFSIETNDTVNTNNSSIIDYSIHISPPYQDGFNFSAPASASICFDLSAPTAVTILVGEGQTPVSAPFDLDTLGPCGQAEPAISVNDVTINEGDGLAQFEVNVHPASNQIIKVDYTTADGNAIAGEDYTSTAGTLEFLAGQTSQNVDVQITDDAINEGPESFQLNLSDPQNAPIADGSATANIVDNEQANTCGDPGIDSSSERAAFLWQDCARGEWHVRLTAAGSFARYNGSLTSDIPLTSVAPYSVETNDIFDTSDPTTINFQLQLNPPYQDGFDFQIAAGANVCLDLVLPAGEQFLVGASRTPVATPFNIVTLESCLPEPPDTPNIVLIVTDDQRWDMNWAMPTMLDKIASRGVNFSNTFVTTPVCSSARANLISGGFYSQNTGGLKNRLGPDPTPPFNGEVEQFKDDDTLPVALQQAGYKTLHVGKYINGYPRIAPYVPPGWTRWVTNVTGSGSDWHTSFRYAIGSSNAQSSMGSNTGKINQYVTDYQRDEILDFIDASGSNPFFVLFSTEAPHYPATPANGDENLFPDYVYRGRGYDESDLSDKPAWVAGPNAVLFAQDEFRWHPSGNDEFYRNQLRSLQAVDRAIGAIVDRVEAAGKLDNTVFIFTSDNGFNWGEHGLHEKLMPYEESIRVPLIVSLPGVTQRSEDHLVAMDLDIPATILELAGVNRPTDGASLLNLISNPASAWNDEVYLQSWGYRTGVFGMWASLRDDRWKFVDYPTGEQELYDLLNDPFELESQHDNPSFASIRNSMEAKLDAQKGLAIGNYYLPSGKVGQSYSAQVQQWGGQGPFTWIPVGQTTVVACEDRRDALTPFNLQNIPRCATGAPAYNPSTEASLFLWKTDNQTWRLRATAGGGNRTYTGQLVANQAFSNVAGVSLEADDTLNSSTQKVIQFELNVGGSQEDGINFTIPPGAFVSMVIEESMPPGLTLNPNTGEISGTPLQSGNHSLNVMIEGTSMATQTGLPQRYIVPYTLEINP